MVLRLELGREPRWGGGAPGPVVGAVVFSLGKVGELSQQRKPRVDLGKKGLLAEVQPHAHQEMEERWGEGTKAPCFGLVWKRTGQLHDSGAGG